MEKESLVRMGKASGASIKVFTDPEGRHEYTIKVVHRKKVVKLCYSPVLRGSVHYTLM